jgi:predicted ATPase
VLERLVDLDVVAEPARIALAEDPSLSQDWGRFARTLLEKSISDHSHPGAAPRIFDRGVPDCLAYARWFDLDTRPFADAAGDFRYHDEALLFPSWGEIYSTDDSRKADYGMAVEFEEVLIQTYRDCGYAVIEVPPDTIEARVSHVRRFLSART